MMVIIERCYSNITNIAEYYMTEHLTNLVHYSKIKDFKEIPYFDLLKVRIGIIRDFDLENFSFGLQLNSAIRITN